jgi:hypothetical protein
MGTLTDLSANYLDTFERELFVGYERAGGDIVTLLDLTPRDFQDNEYFPLGAEKTWWLPRNQKLNPFTLSIQEFPFRGPTVFGQRFTFDVKSVGCGDLLLNTMLQIELGHWLDDTTLLRLESGKYKITSDFWAYAQALGASIVEKAELEIGDSTIETIDGDFLNVFFNIQDINAQFGIAQDGLGFSQPTQARPFPTQDRTLYIPLPFFFNRIKLKEALPLLACKEGSVRIHVTLRPFHQCIQNLTSPRPCVTDTPLGLTFAATNFLNSVQIDEFVTAEATIPNFKTIKLVTQAANTDGEMRQRILRSPFEILRRDVSTFYFEEPLKYATNKTSSDTITVQLPLEVNHPMEEFFWFVRRKGTANQSEWTNYSSVLHKEEDPIYNPRVPLLKSASIQFNGVEIVNADEQFFRSHLAKKHNGSITSYKKFIYGYSLATSPGQHQPSGTLNASRLQTIRLTLNVAAPKDTWEVKVFVTTLQWLRFQNGMANPMFQS